MFLTRSVITTKSLDVLLLLILGVRKNRRRIIYCISYHHFLVAGKEIILPRYLVRIDDFNVVYIYGRV